MYSSDVVARALRLLRQGENVAAIAQTLGVSDRTVREWRAGRLPRRRSASRDVDWSAMRSPAYAYLLGLYLGDGWIARMGRTFSLRLALDDKYPGIIESAAEAMAAIHPRGRVRIVPRIGCSVVSSYWKHWPTALPQHGDGRKHLRPIALTGWQSAITATYPGELIRGLIHSDGCRFVANQRVGRKIYSYARYSFSNRSEDILAIFCEHLDLVGIRWTRPSRWAVAVDRRSEVASLDAFVGPKA